MCFTRTFATFWTFSALKTMKAENTLNNFEQNFSCSIKDVIFKSWTPAIILRLFSKKQAENRRETSGEVKIGARVLCAWFYFARVLRALCA